MLRIHFNDADLARTRLAPAPDPLFEVAASMHRLQSSRGRWAYAGWYRAARRDLRERGLERALRGVLLPLYPRAAYYPDFLTPSSGVEGLEAGLEAYSLLHEPAARPLRDEDPGRSLADLLGRARAIALQAAAGGATTGEIARAAGVSASAASRHATVLRDAGLVTTVRNGPSVLHTLTPAGAAVLRAARGAAGDAGPLS
ncbi:MarR family transcriptional regulator [Streptomyces durocortorensis]|uniref:Helix-turn-helix domain-containing protein n=1 Tax=Streptomyces durocortorensis TaxID=2811104 RepID=A0ABS2I2N4_9ACTN|nr:helix-turn-helix domain-containing protein [Streptomyces durocortorensis]MBM7057469.1 helix-turn-helix domain-containing protein [Streptomyces durocortorensis]